MEEAQRLITTIQQMEASLVDEKANGKYRLDDDELQVTYPLNRCLALLKERHSAMSKLHRERYEQVKSQWYPSENQACADHQQSLLKPSNHTPRISNPRFSKLLSHLLRRTRQSLLLSIYHRRTSAPWTTSSREFTKSIIDDCPSSNPPATRSSNSGRSSAPPRCRPMAR